MGVLLGYARRDSQALLDCALSLPQAWTNEGARGARAGGPAKPPWAPKPQLARPLLTRAFDARVPMAGGTGESGYGKERRRRV